MQIIINTQIYFLYIHPCPWYTYAFNYNNIYEQKSRHTHTRVCARALRFIYIIKIWQTDNNGYKKNLHMIKKELCILDSSTNKKSKKKKNIYWFQFCFKKINNYSLSTNYNKILRLNFLTCYFCSVNHRIGWYFWIIICYFLTSCWY